MTWKCLYLQAKGENGTEAPVLQAHLIALRGPGNTLPSTIYSAGFLANTAS